ncbi:LpxL/LpxP family Kdo(2)-lipid IV(A) lauroyl/palmitoleoyl acyltransferase [Pseudomarimonas arenosa]|uniref:Lipid A biosynthesis acyltransferase n=1 Tax=Pseudomarimonas arenosa TaxID=2774145 RepID=A0AAW3ZPI3_9GAMM|nr:LpxL/LpxP family Kdo(2)-lipid IV(A) lauroyl/palmitoleoyl acyltransferase [Pseudomarimonas arenosa]MBD8526241.1 LpxL/LpxP family Kdo(2)-lipid IV(A) lauroyl/palmitoleoyl acyltransferase [Pseudomarimonas arenosa]
MPTLSSPPPTRLADWPVRCAILIGKGLARLPWSWQLRLGRVLGFLLAGLLPSRRRAAQRNIELCFPDLSAAERKRRVRDSFAALGVGVFEFLRAWWGDIDRLRAVTRIEGLPVLQALIAEKRGILLISGHFLTLELCGRLLCDHAPLAGMYRAHDQRWMEFEVLRGRLRYAAAMFTRDELRGAIRHLKHGGILWYAPDQDMRGKDTVFAPFFGIPAASITATHQLARLTGAAVVPFFHRREGDRYVLRVEPPLPDFPSDDATADTARVNACIEAMVREAPEQYLWVHKRFKRRPAGESSLY